MEPNLTNLSLVVLTLLAAAAALRAARALQRTLRPAGAGVVTDAAAAGAAGTPGAAAAAYVSRQAALTATAGAGSVGLLVYRWSVLEGWSPLHAHVDGLLLIAALLAAATVYLLTRRGLRGLEAFLLPVLTLVLAWAVCAAAWTYRPFDLRTLHPVWRAVHLSCVYLGTLSAAVAAAAGAGYLVFARRMKRHRDPRAGARVATLEAVERVIVRSATLGFVLLTAGLVSGAVVMGGFGGPGSADAGGVTGLAWGSPKVLLAAGAWLTFAVVMNVRFAAAFRGPRAAWLAVAGLVLLLAVYALTTAGDAGGGAIGAPDHVDLGDASDAEGATRCV